MERSAFHKLLAFGLERDASDIHFEVGYPPHYRIHGELLSALKVPALTAHDTEAIARMILEDRQVSIDFTRRFAELDVSYTLAQRGRFRATIFRQRGAVGIVMRLIPIQVLSLDELHLPPAVAEIAGAPRGLVLVTGAAGHGTTTAMAAMVRHINETRHAHIVTIEDPIEFLHEPQRCMIIQREIGSDTESFPDAMNAALRQDPDVIALGEIRDRETAALALRAAQTGQLVLSALHTPDAASTIHRLVGMFETGAQPAVRERLGDALHAIVSLRLLAGTDGKRRVPAVEILRMAPPIRECVRSGQLGELPALLRASSEAHGTQLFDQHLNELVGRGSISRETALHAASSPDAIDREPGAE